MAPRDRSSWPRRGRLLDVGWALFAVANLVAIALLPRWETIPFHFIWVSLTLLYGFRVWSPLATGLVLGAIVVSTGWLIAIDVGHGSQPLDEIAEVPLMSAMFLAMVWHARHRLTAMRALERVSTANLHLLQREQQFVADASHELRTPITVALGHAEMLARELGESASARDALVLVDELGRLRRLADRLLALAVAEDADFLYTSPVDMEHLVMEAIHRWTPTDRRWRLGRLDEAIVVGDADRLTLAVDALIENAVHGTVPGDWIELSVVAADETVTVSVADCGVGLAPKDLDRVFRRFVRAGEPKAGRRRGMGLGLAIVQAVAAAHQGHASAQSTLGRGSTFRLVLPAVPPPAVVADGTNVTTAGPPT